MISYHKELWLHVPTRRAFVNITPQVEECLRESGIQEGLLARHLGSQRTGTCAKTGHLYA